MLMVCAACGRKLATREADGTLHLVLKIRGAKRRRYIVSGLTECTCEECRFTGPLINRFEYELAREERANQRN